MPSLLGYIGPIEDLRIFERKGDRDGNSNSSNNKETNEEAPPPLASCLSRMFGGLVDVLSTVRDSNKLVCSDKEQRDPEMTDPFSRSWWAIWACSSTCLIVSSCSSIKIAIYA